MDYYTSQQIFLSVLYSLIFGVAFGMFSSAVSVLLEYLETLINIPRMVLVYSSGQKSPLTLFREKQELRSSESNIKNAAKDFIITISFGISFSILSYIAADGAFRFYILLLSLIAFYFSDRIPGRGFRWLSLKVLVGVCTLLVFLLSVILYPIRKILRFLKNKLFLPIFEKIGSAFCKHRMNLCKTTKQEAKNR